MYICMFPLLTSASYVDFLKNNKAKIAAGSAITVIGLVWLIKNKFFNKKPINNTSAESTHIKFRTVQRIERKDQTIELLKGFHLQAVPLDIFFESNDPSKVSDGKNDKNFRSSGLILLAQQVVRDLFHDGDYADRFLRNYLFGYDLKQTIKSCFPNKNSDEIEVAIKPWLALLLLDKVDNCKGLNLGKYIKANDAKQNQQNTPMMFFEPNQLLLDDVSPVDELFDGKNARYFMGLGGTGQGVTRNRCYLYKVEKKEGFLTLLKNYVRLPHDETFDFEFDIDDKMLKFYFSENSQSSIAQEYQKQPFITLQKSDNSSTTYTEDKQNAISVLAKIDQSIFHLKFKYVFGEKTMKFVNNFTLSSKGFSEIDIKKDFASQVFNKKVWDTWINKDGSPRSEKYNVPGKR